MIFMRYQLISRAAFCVIWREEQFVVDNCCAHIVVAQFNMALYAVTDGFVRGQCRLFVLLPLLFEYIIPSLWIGFCYLGMVIELG